MQKFFSNKAVRIVFWIFAIALGLRILADMTAGSFLQAPLIGASQVIAPVFPLLVVVLVLVACVQYALHYFSEVVPFKPKSAPAQKGGGNKGKGKKTEEDEEEDDDDEEEEEKKH